MSKTRQWFLSPEWGQVLFLDKREDIHTFVCQPRDIVLLYVEKPCDDEKQLKTDICVDIRRGQKVGEKGLMVNLLYEG